MLFVLLKGLIGFGLPLAFGLWQLRAVKRSMHEDRTATAAATDTPAGAAASTDAVQADAARTAERTPEYAETGTDALATDTARRGMAHDHENDADRPAKDTERAAPARELESV